MTPSTWPMTCLRSCSATSAANPQVFSRLLWVRSADNINGVGTGSTWTIHTRMLGSNTGELSGPQLLTTTSARLRKADVCRRSSALAFLNCDARYRPTTRRTGRSPQCAASQAIPFGVGRCVTTVSGTRGWDARNLSKRRATPLSGSATSELTRWRLSRYTGTSAVYAQRIYRENPSLLALRSVGRRGGSSVVN